MRKELLNAQCKDKYTRSIIDKLGEVLDPAVRRAQRSKAEMSLQEEEEPDDYDDMPSLASCPSDEEDDQPIGVKVKSSERTKLYAPVPAGVSAIDVYCYDKDNVLVEARLGIKRIGKQRLCFRSVSREKESEWCRVARIDTYTAAIPVGHKRARKKNQTKITEKCKIKKAKNKIHILIQLLVHILIHMWVLLCA